MQSVNKKSSNESDESPPKKKFKVECMRKHKYPEILLSADDDVSMERNLQLLKENLKPKPSHKTLMASAHTVHRAAVDSQYSTGISCTEVLHLCKAVYLHGYL